MTLKQKKKQKKISETKTWSFENKIDNNDKKLKRKDANH